jgi:hypothetical protein
MKRNLFRDLGFISEMSLPFDHDDDLRSEQADPLWRLLGDSPLPEPEPWFTARTLARCRRERPAVVARMFRLWRWALGGGLAMMAALFVTFHAGSPAPVSDGPSQESVQAAFEVMATMDTDSTSSSNDQLSWQDNSL